MLQRKAKISSFTGRVLAGTLLSILLCLVAAFHAGAVEQDGAFNTFEESGIDFPGGFDLNTVGDLRGKVVGLYRPVGSGPIILNLETEWERYAVITCPPWYWDKLKVKVSSGEEARVIGSKSLGRDFNLYIVAQEIQLIGQGKSIKFRNKAGAPLWAAHHGQTSSQQNSGNRTRGKK